MYACVGARARWDPRIRATSATSPRSRPHTCRSGGYGHVADLASRFGNFATPTPAPRSCCPVKTQVRGARDALLRSGARSTFRCHRCYTSPARRRVHAAPCIHVGRHHWCLARVSCAAVATWPSTRRVAGPERRPPGSSSRARRERSERRTRAPRSAATPGRGCPGAQLGGPSRMSAMPTTGAQRGVNFAYALWLLLEHRTHQRSIDAWIHALTCENRSYTGDPYTGPSHPYTRIQVNFVAPVLQA